ncbi:hypothetical protein C8F04DRAFT_1259380 [Mycena alexandri]|uniref:Uncharacterized protein n=1 Tax=Mycena alexandri TaxID=1745969 RepID=A0AAD6SW97_9AGAR|nr:hypothetical protein C8F04DRAFT_1259380 [Mycena alexandri]
MSERDNLSDEWLEVDSLSDTDSLSSRDSDHDDLPSEPPSRRSSISIGSSVDGEIDAWEGFADDTPQELLPDADPVVAAFATAEQASPRRVLDSTAHVSDEQLVTAALEQSLVGTLSASRSSSLGVSSTVHNSLRDLRLSFPDPLTSSRDELNRSYEAVSSSETHCITDDDSNSPMTTEFPTVVALPSKESPLKDESSRHLSADADVDALSGSGPLPVTVYCGDDQIKDFDVVLYGSTPQSREFARWLWSIFVTGGVLLSPKDKESLLSRFASGDLDTPSSQTYIRPSLAIISLPSSSPFLPKHTLYLPIIFPTTDNSIQDVLPDPSKAYESWSSLDIPAVQTLRLINNGESQIFVDDEETRKLVDPQFVYRELEPLLPHHPKKPFARLEQLRPVHAVTFVALLSLIMGFAVNTGFRSPAPTPAVVTVTPAQTAPSTFWNMFGTAPNSSVASLTIAPAASTMAIMPSTLKDFAVAVFNPATTTAASVPVASTSAAASTPTASGSGAAGSVVGQSKSMTLAEKAKSTKDIIVRPSTALSNPSSPKSPPTHAPSVGGSMKKVVTTALPVKESAPVSSLSLKLVDSLSQVVDASMKALEEVVGHDFKELMGALDALMRAIGDQAAMIISDSKSRAQLLRERLNYRNERAKGKARELKEMGEQFVSHAGERLKARAEIARTRAQSLRKTFMSTTAWRTYAQAHGEWSNKLDTKRGKGKRRDRKREPKGGLFAKLKKRRENRKNRVAI